MDRNNYLSSNGFEKQAEADKKPPRSTSAPPGQPCLSFAQPEMEIKATASGPANVGMTLVRPFSWNEPHTSYETLMVPIVSVSEECMQGHDFLDRTHYRLSPERLAHGEAMQNEAYYSHGLTSSEFFVPFGASFSRSFGTPQDYQSFSLHRQEEAARRLTAYCSLSAMVDQNDPHRPLGTACSDAGPTSSEEFRSERLKLQPSRGDHGDSKQHAIASGLRSLDLSAHSSAAAIPMHHGIGLMSENIVFPHPMAGQDCLNSERYREQEMCDTWRLSPLDATLQNGLSGDLASLTAESTERELVWGSETQPTSTESSQWNIFSDVGVYSHEMHRGNETWTSMVGASSLTSSRSLPELTWASNSPYFARAGTNWAKGIGDDGLSYHQGGARSSEATIRNGSACVMSTLGALNGSIASATNTAVAATSDTSSTLKSVTPEHPTSAIRMEEGTIGSKRRIWYRAANGQFASATETQYGHSTGNCVGNNEGRARSSDGIRRIRRRRKSEEVERKYRCDYEGCDKAYGTLNREWSTDDGVETAATHELGEKKPNQQSS